MGNNTTTGTNWSSTTGTSWSSTTETMSSKTESIMGNNNSWSITPDKNKHKYVIGIDFGHGETSAAYAEIGWDLEKGELSPVKDIDLPQDKTYVIPSAMSITMQGEKECVHIGADAFEYHDADFHVCFKQKPQSLNGEPEKLMAKFMRAVYDLIRERTGSILTDTNHVVYIATPSGWDKEAQDLYGEMAAQVGIPIAGVTWESRAAFIKAQCSADSGLPQFVDKGAIVFDMGSSTLDFTYISTDVLKHNKKPIDYGYDCGASKVEKLMYRQLYSQNDAVSKFEAKYPNASDRLLFELRRGKEEYYRKPEHKLRKAIDFYELVNDEELPMVRCVYDSEALDGMLMEKGYFDQIRNAMIDFKENHINGKPIYAAFFTGGASRMDFLQFLVKEIWNVDYVFRDQNPSLTISQGVAEAARSDVRSGGSANIKAELSKIMSDVDVYSIFSKKLGEKIEDEIQSSIATPVVDFRDSDEDCCLLDLETDIEDNINTDVQNIGEWAKDCMEEAFREVTGNIREKMSKRMSNYTKSDIKMGTIATQEIELPELDFNVISNQIQELASTLTESASALTNTVTGAAFGAVGAFLLGPIGWIAGLPQILRAIGSIFKTEEEKRLDAKRRDLDKDQRQRVYDEFNNKWSDICDTIHHTTVNALADSEIEYKVNSQCNKVLREYAEECLRQTRLMLD